MFPTQWQISKLGCLPRSRNANAPALKCGIPEVAVCLQGGYVEEIVSGDLPQGGQYASVKVHHHHHECCRLITFCCVRQILYPEGSSSLNHPGLACQVPIFLVCPVETTVTECALVWVAEHHAQARDVLCDLHDCERSARYA